MSRVEEALRRAGRSEELRPWATPAQPEPGAKTDRPSGGTIVDYPCEDPRTEVSPKVSASEPAARASKIADAARRPEPLPSRAAISTSVAARALRRLSDAVQGKVVIDRKTPAVSIEEYRRLAATLHGMQVESGIKTIMISSALPRDGKTLTTTNIALTLSESHKRRVLVIDADLRRPSIHEVFSLPNERGLAEGLREPVSGTLAVMEVSPNLAVLTAGVPDRAPMAGLTSDRMKDVLADASARFDWILLDTPPIGLISDAQLLSSLVDGVVLVIRAGATDYGAIAHTIGQLGRERILGVVLNRVAAASSSRHDYHEYYGAAPVSVTGTR